MFSRFFPIWLSFSFLCSCLVLIVPLVSAQLKLNTKLHLWFHLSGSQRNYYVICLEHRISTSAVKYIRLVISKYIIQSKSYPSYMPFQFCLASPASGPLPLALLSLDVIDSSHDISSHLHLPQVRLVSSTASIVSTRAEGSAHPVHRVGSPGAIETSVGLKWSAMGYEIWLLQ